MPLNQEQILEIQSAAKYNTEKRIRDAQDEANYKEELAQTIEESRKPKLTPKTDK